MNEIEKTIRVLSDMKLSFSQNYIQEAFDVSIEALREKAEREKGCVWCKSDSQVTHNGEHFCFFCSYCGKRLEVEHE
jgi:hypothetical protein